MSSPQLLTVAFFRHLTLAHVRMAALLNIQMDMRGKWGVLRVTFLADVEGEVKAEAKTVPDYESCGAVWVSSDRCHHHRRRRRHRTSPALSSS